MRIESIEIHNFRQYRNVTFKFPNETGKNDLHIIYAKNGVGKTNVLNAITWCLYDTEMHLGDKYTANVMLNNQLVQELRKSIADGGNVIGDVTVKIMLSSDDGSEKILFQRVGKFNVSNEAVIPLNSAFTVMHFIDGEWNNFEIEEETIPLVKKNVPEEIHDYIFFDGEHLENYFKAGQNENIKNGIEELTQAKIIEKAEVAFNKYLSEVLNPQIANSSVKDIASAQKDLDDIQNAIDTSSNDINTMTTQIHNCDDKIATLDNIISGHSHVSEKTAKLKEVEGFIDSLKIEIQQKKAEMMVFAREYIQYFALYPAIKSLYKYIQEQDNHGNLPPRIDKFLLEAIAKHKHCLVCDQDLSDHSYSFIEQLRKEIEVSSETSALLNKTIVILRQYLTKLSEYKSKRDSLIKEQESLQNKYNKYLEEEKKLNTYLLNIPNTEAITKAIEQKKELREERDKIVAKKGVEEDHKKELENQYSAQDKKLKSLIEKNQQLEKVNKQAEYCKLCRNILKETRSELLAESRSEMEKETFNTFLQLLWKKDAFSKVEILEDYTFRLLDIYGIQTLGSCSAAERALLALSFTLALQKVSMHDSLLFIDTPIGRVDTDNRLNFVNTLCEIAKAKQVILTFTPAEYDDNVAAALQNQFASFSKLTMEDGITIIKK
ncbi:MAG: AAA family ATPase [Bacteroidales bacterium]|nr:AAA family ATPase [Bacteroidales bacterium]